MITDITSEATLVIANLKCSKFLYKDLYLSIQTRNNEYISLRYIITVHMVARKFQLHMEIKVFE